MRSRIFFILIATFILFFGFSSNASAQSLGQCNTSYSRESSGGCGTSCPSLCNNVTTADGRRQKCLDALKTDTDLWNKYELKETELFDRSDLYLFYYYDFEPVSTNISVNRICSTGDKLCPSASSCSATSNLYAGQCDCAVGSVNKTCCLITKPANKSYSPREPWLATSTDVDGIAPLEAFCSGSNVETIKGSSCPQPPAITLTANGSGGSGDPKRVKVKNGVNAEVKWTVNGYDRIRYSNIPGVAESPSFGTYTFIPFDKGTLPGAEHPLRISADDDYLIPCASSDFGCKETVIGIADLILVSEGDAFSSCPLILDKTGVNSTCESYNYQPKLPFGQTASDGTDNDYSKEAKIYKTEDKTKYASVADNKLCCSLVCSRCSTNNPGKFASWTGMPDNTCNGDWSTVKYEPAGSGSDLRCSEPSKACVINNWKIDPTTLQKGKKTTISWEAKPNPKTPEDLIKSCVMKANNVNPTNEKAIETGKEFGPITEDTTYALECAALSGKTCSASGTVKVGCEIINFSSDGSKISDAEYETTSSSATLKWQVKDSDSCKINGSQVSPAAEGSKSYSPLSKGTNSFKLSCETRSNPSVLCDKTIVVKKTETISPGQCSIDTFTATPSTVNQGQTSKLAWTSTQASGCTLSSGGSFGANDSTTVSPTPPSSSYTLTCNTIGYTATCTKSLTIPVTSPPVSACVGSYSDVSISVSASPQCLPSQPGGGTSSIVSYSASAGSSCSTAIGGGSPSNSNISCTTPGWNPSGGKQTVSPSQTTSYSVSCSRPDYTCSRSDQTYETSGACDSSRVNTLTNSYVSSASCGSYCDSGSYTYTTDTRICEGCTSCSSWGPYYDYEYSCNCKTDPETKKLVCETCIGRTRDCEEWRCATDLDYRLSITSKPICGSSGSNSTQVRVITKPNSPTITSTAKNVSGSTYQILLNQFFNLSFSVSAPDSLVPTILRCTASGKGDPETWDDKGLNGFGSSGNIYDLFKSYLSPSVSTTYYLWCRNQDQTLPNSCYNDGPTNSVEVKVYTPDLQEKGPSSYNFVKKFMGMILR